MRLKILSRFLVTLLVIVAATVVGWNLWTYYMRDPWTRDARVRADVVTIAPDVSGLVAEVAVHDNQAVRQGDLLFRIDSQRAELAVRQAEAALANRRAAMINARHDAERYHNLPPTAVSRQQQEQSETASEQAEAAYDQAMADRDLARLNLARTRIYAPADGVVTNLSLRPGNYVAAGQGVMVMVESRSLHVTGYFEETKLPRIRIGSPVSIWLMGENQMLRGHVESIAGGIADRERSDTGSGLANVNPIFSWVRLAQRVPVRIALDQVPEGVLLVPGRTATVAVESAR